MRLKRLIRNSVNPLLREKYYHTCYTTDLLVLKLAHTAVRIAGFLRENQFLITTVFDNHDDYERNICKYQLKDFENVRFVQYTEEEDIGVSDDYPDEVAAERDKLLIVNKNLQQTLREREDTWQELTHETEAKVGNYTQKLAESGQRIQELETENAALKNSKPVIPKGIIARLRYLLRGEL